MTGALRVTASASDSPNEIAARSQRFRKVRISAYLRSKWLERKRTVVTSAPQSLYLPDIVEAIVAVHENPVRIAHFGNADLEIGHAGNVHETGEIGEEIGFACQMVMKGVMNQSERPTDAVDRFNRLPL